MPSHERGGQALLEVLRAPAAARHDPDPGPGPAARPQVSRLAQCPVTVAASGIRRSTPVIHSSFRVCGGSRRHAGCRRGWDTWSVRCRSCARLGGPPTSGRCRRAAGRPSIGLRLESVVMTALLREVAKMTHVGSSEAGGRRWPVIRRPVPDLPLGVPGYPEGKDTVGQAVSCQSTGRRGLGRGGRGAEPGHADLAGPPGLLKVCLLVPGRAAVARGGPRSHAVNTAVSDDAERCP